MVIRCIKNLIIDDINLVTCSSLEEPFEYKENDVIKVHKKCEIAVKNRPEHFLILKE